jgi:hypothetical protein
MVQEQSIAAQLGRPLQVKALRKLFGLFDLEKKQNALELKSTRVPMGKWINFVHRPRTQNCDVTDMK